MRSGEVFRLMLLGIGGAAVVLAVVHQNFVLLSFISALLLGMAYYYIVSLSELKRMVEDVLADAGIVNRREALGRREVSRKCLRGMLDALRCRLGRLSWQIETLVHRQPDLCGRKLVQEVLWYDRESGETTPATLYEALLRMVYQGLQCSAAAIVVYDSSSPEDEGMFLSVGKRGRRLRASLWHGFESYLHGKSEIQQTGFLDHEYEERLLGDLKGFDIRYSMVFPISSVSGKPDERVLFWIGFPAHYHPEDIEYDWVRRFARHVSEEVESTRQLSELRASAEEALQSSERKSDFLAHFSHDIRSPLNNIRSIMHLFQLEGFGADGSELVETALGNCDMLHELVDSILEYSKYTTGKLMSQPVYLHLSEAIEEVVESYRSAAKAKNISLKFVLSDGSCVPDLACLDRRQLRRITSNLLSNAVKYTRTAGSIEVSIDSTEDTLLLKVRDTGCGMSPDQIEQLFAPFTRFQNAENDGVGLGLTLTKVLTEKNGGKIHVRSTPGRGTEFKIVFERIKVLPPGAALSEGVRTARTQVALQESRRAELNPARQNVKVLVVDDDDDFVESQTRLISRKGYSVHGVTTIIDAIAICNFEMPDIVLTDCQMPEGGADRLIRFLSAQLPCPAVLVLSGDGDGERKHQLLSLGAAETWVKPADPEELCRWIDERVFGSARLVA